MNRRAQAMAPLRWLGALILIVGIGAVLLLGGWRYLRPVVKVTRPVEGPVVQAFYATGTVSPDREYAVRSNVAGIIMQMTVDKGDRIKKGQVLAVIENDDLVFRLKQAQAELAEKEKLADEKSSPTLAEFDARIAALADIVEIAKRENQRVQAILEKNGASEQDLDRTLDRLKMALSDYESTKAQRATKKIQLEKDVVVARAALVAAQWNFDQQTVRSPIDGVVLDRPESLGTRMAINDHLMQVADVSPGNLVMRAAVDEEDKVKVTLGQTVEMSLYSFPEQVLAGRVKKIYDKAESSRRTFEVDVAFDSADPRRGQLSPGMTGELAFVVEAKDKAMVVPTQALQNGTIWSVRDGRLTATDARIGLKSVERVEVISGLREQDQVVISPVAKLEAGQMVATEFVDPLQAAGLNKPKVTTGGFRGFR